MASVSISFLIPSSSATNTDLPCFTLLGERHVDYVIADYNETFSSVRCACFSSPVDDCEW